MGGDGLSDRHHRHAFGHWNSHPPAGPATALLPGRCGFRRRLARHCSLPKLAERGTAVGPLAAGALLTSCGWRPVFVINVPLALMLLLLLGWGLPPRRIDRHRSPPIASLSGQGRRLLGRLVAHGCVAAVMMATLVVGPFYLEHQGLEPARVGVIVAVGPFVSMLSGPPAGRLVDRFGAASMTLWSLGGLLVGCVARQQRAHPPCGALRTCGVVGPTNAVAQPGPHGRSLTDGRHLRTCIGADPGRRSCACRQRRTTRHLRTWCHLTSLWRNPRPVDGGPAVTVARKRRQPTSATNDGPDRPRTEDARACSPSPRA